MKTFFTFAYCLLLGCITTQHSQASVSDRTESYWIGSLQVWEKISPQKLPSPLSPAVPLRFKMKRPGQDYQTFFQTLEFNEGGQKIKVTAYWNRTPSQDFALIQIKIDSVAECSFYFEPWKDQSFPGGVCSGFLNPIGHFRQIGVTFRPQ